MSRLRLSLRAIQILKKSNLIDVIFGKIIISFRRYHGDDMGYFPATKYTGAILCNTSNNLILVVRQY